MSEFQFLQNPFSEQWVILAPRRARRPDEMKKLPPFCPFCSGREGDEEELYRVGGTYPDSNWHIRVLHNKFPFAPRHEIIVHSPDHHKSFGELPLDQVETILQVYRQRYLSNQKFGHVAIFHNHGHEGGESLPHPHTQLAVIPKEVSFATPPLGPVEHHQETAYFTIFCPLTSQWPDEVWVAPKRKQQLFGEITDEEVEDLAFILNHLVDLYNLRHGHEFPYNFYIYPGKNWYLRLMPREKSLGGFEIGTGIFINTQDPRETMAFIKEHFARPDFEKIKHFHRAEYKKHA